MIRVAVIDDHPALRAGLRTVIEAEAGLAFAGESDGNEESVWPLLRRSDPDVVLLDYHLPSGDGLQLCHRIKRQVKAPRVLVYSAYASAGLLLPARLAGADGVLDKGLPARELFDAIRLVHRGEMPMDEPSQYVMRESLAQLDEADRPIVGMLLDGASESEVAQTLRMDVADVDHALRRVLARLRAQVPAGAS